MSNQPLSFEEEYPSLKEGVFIIREEKGAVSKNLKHFSVYLDEGEEVVCTNVIEAQCLDKQKVKEAILRLPDNNRRHILLTELNL